MKLLRVGPLGFEKPAVIDQDGQIRDLSSVIVDINARVLAQTNLLALLATTDIDKLPIIAGAGLRIGPCLDQVGKIMCIAYNSQLHTEQMGHKLMENGEIMVFLKAPSAICGPCDPIVYTPLMKKLDWEAELAVVIAKKGKYIAKEQALDYVLGYTCMNDLSDRYWQFETQDKQYTKGKSMDSCAPLGPYLVTKDEIPNAAKLQVTLQVNGEMRQNFTTNDYINDVATVISYISQFFSLLPGDVISMGSAPGNAKFWGEDKYLKVGDKVELAITGLGRQEQLVISETKF